MATSIAVEKKFGLGSKLRTFDTTHVLLLAAVLGNSAPAADINMRTRLILLHGVRYTDANVYQAEQPNPNLSMNTRK